MYAYFFRVGHADLADESADVDEKIEVLDNENQVRTDSSRAML